jgi:predicted transcriptional regulator
VTDLVDVLSPVAGIRRTDLRTYRALLSAPKSTTHEIGQEVDRHRSSVNRSLDRLRAAGLVSRRRRVLDAGGHAYVYRATPPEEARESLHDLVEQWVERAHERVAELDRDGDRDGRDGTDAGGPDPGGRADV